MNAIWNRYLSPNIRILLINNEGGAVMHMPFNVEDGKTLSNYTSAGHQTSAKGWVESLGFKYLAARNQEEVDQRILELTNTSILGPAILEVFTNKEEDIQILKDYFSSLNRNQLSIADRVQKKAGRLISKYLGNK
jgi:2-succinyl-5-enolpyruvyl-6-hydroxy-3-cyclohexene-1-carboxylate synthase